MPLPSHSPLLFFLFSFICLSLSPGGGFGLQTHCWNEEWLSSSWGQGKSLLPVIAAASPSLSLAPQQLLLVQIPCKDTEAAAEVAGRRAPEALAQELFTSFPAPEPLVAAAQPFPPRIPGAHGAGEDKLAALNRTGPVRDVQHQTGGFPPSSQLVICSGAEWNSRAVFKPHGLWRRGIPAVPVEGIPTPERIWVGPDSRVHHRIRCGSHRERPGWVWSRATLQKGCHLSSAQAARLGDPSLLLGCKQRGRGSWVRFLIIWGVKFSDFAK